MKVALFGGSFDPVHREHVALVRAAIRELKLDKIFVIPSHIAPHKSCGAAVSGEDRLKMCEIAFRNVPGAEACGYELAQGGTSYSYLTVEHFATEYPGAELYFLVGADMLENFFFWKNPEKILAHAALVACGRGDEGVETWREPFRKRFGKDFLSLSFRGEAVSSTAVRTALAFGKVPGSIDENVYGYIAEKGLYTHPAIAPALALEREPRREHSFRVALMAAARARSAGVPEGKALLAAALHDCGKYVPLSSPLLAGFVPPEGVPEPVMHQYTGAYLAEHEFGISDEEILDAIRYHTSGRADMTALGKLIFLADALEEGRSYEGIGELRKLFYKDLDECLYAALQGQIDYVKQSGLTVYPLQEEALKSVKNTLKR